MKRVLLPELWLPVVLLVLAEIGAAALQNPACIQLSERDRAAYGQRPAWQARFDAVSATCGVGVLSYDLKQDYTPLGRWMLAVLGFAGAAAYVAATWQIVGRFTAGPGRTAPEIPKAPEPAPGAPAELRAGARPAWPPIHAVLLTFLAGQAAMILLVWLVELVARSSTGFADAAWRAMAAFSATGMTRDVPAPRIAWVYAVVALLGTLGWPVWLLVWPRWRLRGPAVRTFLVAVGGYVILLVLAAGLMTVLEMPRGKPRGGPVSERLDAQPESVRFGRCVVQAVAAAGAGLPTEAVADRGVSEGTKMVLGGLLVLGGFGSYGGGGVKWIILLGLLAASVGGDGQPRCELRRRGLRAGRAALLTSVVYALVVTFGLLINESYVASGYQAAPTFADAWVEGASLACGGNFPAGVTATVTSANLSRGIRQNVDLYQYGMFWIVPAMFVGAVLPVMVAGRCSAGRCNAAS